MPNLYDKQMSFESVTYVSDEMGGMIEGPQATVTADVAVAIQPVDATTRIEFGRLGVDVTEKVYVRYTTAIAETMIAVDTDGNEYKIESIENQGGKDRVLKLLVGRTK